VDAVTITHPDKVLFPAVGFTKADLAAYDAAVARYLLPHLRDRPVTLKRYPEGVGRRAFWEKNAASYRPAWVRTFPVPRAQGGPDVNYVLIDDRRTLLWCANVGAIELHPFLHRVPAIDTPTLIVFDLDPGEGVTILDCATVAFLLEDTLERLRLRSFVKTSGSKGLQVYVPLNTPTTYAATGAFAHALARLLEAEHPRLVVSEMAKARRRGKVFIDWSQNAAHKTTVAVYSLRAKRERPFVSMPLTWAELERARRRRRVEALDFGPDAALKRLAKVGDLFAPVLRMRQRLPEGFGEV
jgi:bifunctional non-homologous end joining protein LigD